jgi:hypothetical protein
MRYVHETWRSEPGRSSLVTGMHGTRAGADQPVKLVNVMHAGPERRRRRSL